MVRERSEIWPCADGNDSGTDAQQTAQDGWLLAKLNKYWEWIQEEPRIVGLTPYHWTDSSACLKKNVSACRHMCYGHEGPGADVW